VRAVEVAVLPSRLTERTVRWCRQELVRNLAVDRDATTLEIAALDRVLAS
jgi:hypothetical protein